MDRKTKQEIEFNKAANEALNKARTSGILAGANGICGAVLEMCNSGKRVKDIKTFCEQSLGIYKVKDDSIWEVIIEESR